MTPIEESIEGAAGVRVKTEGEDPSTASADAGKPNLIRSLNVGNAKALDARLRKELEDQGILSSDEDDKNGGGGGDEILEELRRCQNELRAVSTHNANQLKRVLGAARSELVRQELRNRLASADTEVWSSFLKLKT